jgi:hypothetical protein
MGRRGNQGVVELEPHLIVVPWQQIDIEMNQRLQNGKLQALGCVHDRNAARVPPSAVLSGSQPGESLVEKSLARDPPQQHDADPRRFERLSNAQLIKVAVLDTTELIGDERRACIRDEQAEGCESLEGTVGAREPFASLCLVAKGFDCALCYSSHAGNTVALLRCQDALLLAPLRRALIGIDEAHEGRSGLTKEFAEMLDGGVLEAEPY